MRIAQISPLYESVPPRLYGGTERVVSYLTEALVELGHEVTLFASGDSVTAAALHPVWPAALRLDPALRDTVAPHMLLLETVRQHAAQFDVLHFHLDYWAYPLFSRQPTPYLATVHGRLDWPETRTILQRFRPLPLVPISASQRDTMPDADWQATVHHGLPQQLLMPAGGLEDAPLESSTALDSTGYLAFLGRIAPEKGVDAAIRIAARCGMRLKIAAKIDAADRAFYERSIAPLLTQPHVEFMGEISDAEKPAFLSGARALLFPIDWSEPFGLVMIEAMACGTPVIAYRRGSVAEVIEDGVSGFVVADEAAAVAAVQRLHLLSRRTVRACFEARFTARRMALDYVAVYRNLLRARA